MEIILISWIFSIAVATLMAKDRGRGAANGFLGGLLFSWLSVLYYLIVGDSTEVRVRKEEEIRTKMHDQKNRDEHVRYEKSDKKFVSR